MSSYLELWRGAILPIIAVLGLIALTELVLCATGASPAEPAKRFGNIDGLRAFLALGVVCSHLATLREFYLSDGTWRAPVEAFLVHAGEASVMVFFMITGFLFWNKAVLANGRLSPLWLYPNRFLRIMPLYFLFYLIVLSIVAVQSHFHLAVGATQLARELGGFALPGFRPAGLINGISRDPMATQSWTLLYEVFFYVALPFLAYFARNWLHFVGLTLLLAGWARFSSGRDWVILSTFWIGMLAAQGWGVRDRCRLGWLKSPVVSACVVLAITLPGMFHKGAEGRLGLAVFGVFFCCVALGNPIFGLLSCRASRLLGEISYSIYLLHLPILYAALMLLNHFFPVAAWGDPLFWSVSFGLMGTVCALSYVTYTFVEKPFMRLGKIVKPPAV